MCTNRKILTRTIHEIKTTENWVELSERLKSIESSLQFTHKIQFIRFANLIVFFIAISFFCFNSKSISIEWINKKERNLNCIWADVLIPVVSIFDMNYHCALRLSALAVFFSLRACCTMHIAYFYSIFVFSIMQLPCMNRDVHLIVCMYVC